MANIKRHKVILRFKNDDFMVQLEKLLMEVGVVKVTGLGIFEIRVFPPRKGYNVHTKKLAMLKNRNRIVFKPTKSLKLAVQKYAKA